MEDYEKVNKEIQDFLSVHPYSEYKNEHRPISKEIDNKDNLLFLLESLQSLYNEINTNLKYGNEQGIKDALLKNDIKIALVNDSLISTLKNTIQEKNTLLNENKKLIQLKNEYEESQLKSKYYSQKLENDINYKTSSIAELKRIIQDQKQKQHDIENAMEKLKQDSVNYKIKIEELEGLRKKSSERFSFYNKEMESLNKILQERENTLKEFVKQKQNEDSKNASLKLKLSEYEKKVDDLTHKLTLKEKSLQLCNSEINKLTMENKKYNMENEKHKTNSIYYENLNKNLNEQNAYLNRQLNKIIQSEKYAKEGINIYDVYESKKKKYRKKFRKLQNELNKIKDENEELKEKLEENCYKVSGQETVSELQKKIEMLSQLNQEYKQKLNEANKHKNQSSIISEDTNTTILHHNNRTGHPPTNPYNIKYDNLSMKINQLKETLNSTIQKDRYFQNDKSRVNDKLKNISLYNNITKDTIPSSIANSNYKVKTALNLNPIYKPIELENKYPLDQKTNDKKNVFIGGFEDESTKLEEYSDIQANSIYKAKDQLGEKFSLLNSLARKADTTINTKNKTDIDNESNDSLISYHTSTTLKEMMERTEQLQKKFKNLENELEQINDNKTEETLKKQMKLYDGFYKNINVDNENDIL